MTTPSPSDLKTQHPLGKRLEGEIDHVWQFGLRVRLPGGLTGLIRNTELSWDDRVRDAREFVCEGRKLADGQKLTVSVLGYRPREEDLLLSLRRAVYDPWEHLPPDLTVGKRVRGVVSVISRSQATVDLADCEGKACLTARLPKEEIPLRDSETIEEVLDRGDTIEALVQQIDHRGREIVVSMRARLDQLAAELQNAPAGAARPGVDTTLPANGPAPDPVASTRRKIERVLVIDDEADQMLGVETFLDELGIVNARYCQDFAQGAQLAVAEPFDLVLLDVKGTDNPEAGLAAAEMILAARPRALVVLVTGDQTVLENERARRILYSTAGLILKPIDFETLDEAIDRLERIGHAGWPGLLPDADRPGRRFGKGIAHRASDPRSETEVLEAHLRDAMKQTGAEAAAIFNMDRRTSRVTYMAGVNIDHQKIQLWREKLPKSPINDVIYEDETIFASDVERRQAKFRNLLRIVAFNDCIGVKLPHTAGDLGYGLFLFRNDGGRFIDADLQYARAAAGFAGLAIRERWLIHQIASDQRLTMLGSTMASVGHELRNRLGDVMASAKIESAWQELRGDPTRLRDPEFTDAVEKNLERLKSARNGLPALSDLLLGAAPDRPAQDIDVNDCVKIALRLVGYEAKRERINLGFDLTPTPLRTRGNVIELQHVFLNVLLNAIQQIPRAGRGTGRIMVKTALDRREPQRPIRVQIIDSGPGIHAKDRDRIFEPMFSTKDKGTGLGLYICRDVLSTMGGAIEVSDTAVMIGSTFEIRLPTALQER